MPVCRSRTYKFQRLRSWLRSSWRRFNLHLLSLRQVSTRPYCPQKGFLDKLNGQLLRRVENATKGKRFLLPFTFFAVTDVNMSANYGSSELSNHDAIWSLNNVKSLNILASQDAPEVMFAYEWATECSFWDLTDVTLVSEDTYWRLYWYDSGKGGY